MSTTPFDYCSYAECDLPGQCLSEGKCHHPDARHQLSKELSAANEKIAELEKQVACARAAAIEEAANACTIPDGDVTYTYWPCVEAIRALASAPPGFVCVRAGIQVSNTKRGTRND